MDCMNSYSLPPDAQYWSMCGDCTDENNKPHPNSEIGQMLAAGIITQSQFHGVDTNQESIINNKTAYPDANWHHGQIYDVLREANTGGWLNPSIVNIDTPFESTTAVNITVDAMLALRGCNNFLLISNMVVNMMNVASKKVTDADVIKRFNTSKNFSIVWDGTWECFEPYRYRNPESPTEMLSLIFLKN